jgi:hypothetical protein
MLFIFHVPPQKISFGNASPTVQVRQILMGDIANLQLHCALTCSLSLRQF